MNRGDAESFLYREASLLDQKRYDDWVDLFRDDALYWIPANKGDYDPRQHVSFVYDNMTLLKERIGRLVGGHCHSQQPASSTLHTISNVEVETLGQGHVRVLSNAVIYEFRNNAQRRFYPLQTFPAFCTHELREEQGRWRIASKKVALLNADGEIFDLSFLL
jgi:3-phenylpropionate/cinnamic acid dioxygenase small subunit